MKVHRFREMCRRGSCVAVWKVSQQTASDPNPNPNADPNLNSDVNPKLCALRGIGSEAFICQM